MSLGPLSDSHLASGLDTRASDWMLWIQWGWVGSLSVDRGQVSRPFDNTCQGPAPLGPHLLNQSLQPLLFQSAPICTLGNGLMTKCRIWFKTDTTVLWCQPPLIPVCFVPEQWYSTKYNAVFSYVETLFNFPQYLNEIILLIRIYYFTILSF